MSFSSFQHLYAKWRKMQPGGGHVSVESESEIFDEREIQDDELSWSQQLLESASCRKKFRIWEETQGTCIYCGRSISAPDFINGIDSDIEHILPQALCGRSVLDNLICSCRECNRAKGDLAAMDFMLSQSPEALSRYLMRLRLLSAAGLLSLRKYRALTIPKALITLDVD